VETRSEIHPRINPRPDVRAAPRADDGAMSISDYIIDSALVLLVLLQIRERELTTKQMIRPLVILGIAVINYLHGIPTSGDDLVLAGTLALLGGLIGVASGYTVIFRRTENGRVLFRAGWLSGIFWVLGMGSRFAFAYWSSHGGMSSIATFSAQHSISGGEAWTVALLAMAAFEVLGRTGVLAIRRRELSSPSPMQLA
jgi:hypothetical protein